MSKAIRVLHIVTQMNLGGLESRLMDLYRAIDRDKVQFDFYTLRKEKGYFDNEILNLGGRIIYNSPIKVFSIQKCRSTFNKFLHRNPYQVVHSHICELSPILLSVAKLLNVKNRIVHSRHASLNPGLKSLYKKFIKMFIPLYATDYFTVSKEAGYWLFGKTIMESGKVNLVKNAISAKKFRYNKDLRKKKKKEFGFSDKNIIIGLVGNFRYPKNHIFLIDIFNEISKINKNVYLLLIGDGSYKNKIYKKVKELGHVENVKFLGKRDDVYELLQIFDVFVMPSIYEGMPGAAIEAQAAGLPVVMSSNITTEAQITKNAYYIDLDKSPKYWALKILSIYNNFIRKDTYKVIVNKGYDSRMEAKKLEDIYLKMVGEKV